MLCPNDHVRLHPVSVPGPHGQSVTLDQCEGCGGLWFDGFELYKAQQEPGESLALLDQQSLVSPSGIEELPLRCPRDKAELFQFTEPRFPGEIILMRCSRCAGFWLNRGTFNQYLEARENLVSSQKKKHDDPHLDARVEKLLAAHRANNNDDVLRKAGAFLSSPVLPGSGTGQLLPENQGPLDLVIGILVSLLRIFVFRTPF